MPRAMLVLAVGVLAADMALPGDPATCAAACFGSCHGSCQTLTGGHQAEVAQPEAEAPAACVPLDEWKACKCNVRNAKQHCDKERCKLGKCVDRRLEVQDAPAPAPGELLTTHRDGFDLRRLNKKAKKKKNKVETPAPTPAAPTMQACLDACLSGCGDFCELTGGDEAQEPMPVTTTAAPVAACTDVDTWKACKCSKAKRVWCDKATCETPKCTRRLDGTLAPAPAPVLTADECRGCSCHKPHDEWECQRATCQSEPCHADAVAYCRECKCHEPDTKAWCSETDCKSDVCRTVRQAQLQHLWA